MSICASGASTTKAGVPASVVVDTQYIQSLLPVGLSQLYPYLPYMHGLQIGDVGAFCAADPPTWTVPSASDFFNFITGGSLAQAQAVSNFLDALTQAYLWQQLCQCTTGTTPAPTPPTLPTGLPAVNPPIAVGPAAGTGCGTYQSDKTKQLLADNYTSLIGVVVPATQALTTGVPLPVGATSMSVTFTSTVSGANHTASFPEISCYNASNTATVSIYPGNNAPGTSLASGASVSGSAAIPATSTQFAMYFENAAAGQLPTDLIDGVVTFYCGGARPGGTQSPCCPPDPVQTGYLQQLLQMVTLIQRQHVPFAYVTGISHAGLTGAATISIEAVVGLKVAVTTLPTRAGQEAGDPVSLWDVGWIALGTADGFGPRIFISSNPMLVQPVPGDVTIVGYSIPADVVVTITELIREP
jgi:hypothetical protein